MDRRILVLLLLIGMGGGCGRDEGSPPGTPTAEAPGRSATATEASGKPAASSPGAPSTTGSAAPAASSGAEPADPDEPTDPKATSRWYEVMVDGQKTGWTHVVWRPSTWEGRPTVRDTTTQVTRSTRRMDRVLDTFEVKTVTDLERSEDGEWWWSRSVTTEGNREKTTEISWKGDGYEFVERVAGAEERRRIDTDAPVHVDAEAFLGRRIVAGAVKAGDTFDLRVPNFAGDRVDLHRVEVVGPSPAPGIEGPVPATLVRDRDPKTGNETLLWIDGEGAFVALKNAPLEIRRAKRDAARAAPTRTASYSITLTASPALERIFSADQTEVDVLLSHDPDRPLPEFPKSPFSHTTGVEGSAEAGWTVHVTLTDHDVPDAKATIPVKDAAFARHLEHTAFMPCMHPDVVAAAKRAVGNETDARRAAARLSRFVFSTLEKKSSEINETTALEILQSGSGDCSEHALLFVTLCRSVGIPARRCSGYCCIGTIWGAHAWAEVWTGEWIGVDPTTDDVGTAARYVFFGYQDDPDSTNGVVSMRVRGRMKIRTTAVVEGDERVDLRDTANHRVVDLERRTASHRLAGIEMRDIPKEWKVVLRGAGDATIRGEGFSAKIRVMADQGSRDVTPSDEDGRKSTFAGAPALRMDHGGRTTFLVASRRRHVWIDVEHPGLQRKEIVPALERVLAKTFSMRPGK